MPARAIRPLLRPAAILVFALLGAVLSPVSGTAAYPAESPDDLSRALTLSVPAHRSRFDLAPGGSAQTEAAAGGPADGPALRARDSIQTPHFFALVSPVDGGVDGAFVRVHGYGDVAVTDGAGQPVWTRSARSFYEDWGIEPKLPPLVLMGTSPLDPFVLASERPYAVGDLTGDGVDDVALAHLARPATYEEDEDGFGDFLIQEFFSEVTVLDGRDGATLWNQRYPGYVTQLIAAGETLVVGNETGDVRLLGADEVPVGQNGSTSRLLGYRFGELGGEMTVDQAWATDTQKGWARWLAAEPIGEDRVAISWSATPVGVAGTKSRVLFLDPATGEARWSVELAGYARTLRHDESRDLVVVHELAEPGLRLDYTLRGLRVADGSEALSVSRAGAVLLSLEVADVAEPAGAEWISGDHEQLPVTPVAQGSRTYLRARITAADPGSETDLWSHVIPAGQELAEGRGTGLASLPAPYEIVVSGGNVLVGSLSGLGHGLMALDGADGTEVWERFGSPAFPLSLTELRVGDTDRVLGVTEDHIARLFDPADGRIALQSPILSNIQALQIHDVNEDETSDLVVGTRSGGVWALDGSRLSDQPGVLWRADAGSPVHEIHLADLDGDGVPEVVVAATRGVEVFSATDGSSRYRLEYPAEDLVWTVAVGDLDGDTLPDLVVPSRTLAGYRGRDGSKLWEFSPPDVTARFSTTVITPDGRVVSQGMVQSPVNAASRHYRLAVGLEAGTGEIAWMTPQPGAGGGARLWRSVATGQPTASGGTEVAMTWERPAAAISTISPDRPVVDVIDSATGTVLYTTGLIIPGQMTQGTFLDPEHGFVQHDMYGAASVTAAGTKYVETQSFSDLGLADLGTGERTAVGAWHMLKTFPADALSGAQGPSVFQTGRWEGLEAQRVQVVDVDGDGIDEVVTMAFDWPTYLTLSAFTQALTPTASPLQPVMHMGVAVLEA
ncbi:MAG: FG-GAP-like repeat-containing protein [Actinomycetota bacterium]